MLFRPPDRLEVTLQPGGFLAPDGQSITVSVLALGWSERTLTAMTVS